MDICKHFLTRVFFSVLKVTLPKIVESVQMLLNKYRINYFVISIYSYSISLKWPLKRIVIWVILLHRKNIHLKNSINCNVVILVKNKTSNIEKEEIQTKIGTETHAKCQPWLCMYGSITGHFSFLCVLGSLSSH